MISLRFLATAGLLTANAIFALGQQRIHQTLPNGREIQPEGSWIPLAPYPFALAVRDDDAQAAIPSIGFPFSLNIVEGPASGRPSTHRMPDSYENDPSIEVDAGVAYSRDGKRLFVSTGESGKIKVYSTADWKQTAEKSVDGLLGGKVFQKSFTAALTLSPDGTRLYVIDQGNWRVVILNAQTLDLVSSVNTGRYPFGIAVSPKGDRVYVTNSGLFEYETIPQAGKPDGGELRFPPFGYPSAAARNGAIVDGKRVPGLGDENSDAGSSLWTFDVRDPRHASLTAKFRLGERISEYGRGTIGGAAPTGVAATGEAVFVTLAHEDSVAKIDVDGTHLISKASLSPFLDERFQDRNHLPLRGVMPSGIVARGAMVYVAEAGINAVAVLDASTMKVIEHIPVGWNPSAVAVSQDGSILYVVNSKGRGSGPNAGKDHDPAKPTYIGSLESGSLTVIRLAGLPAPDQLTQSVIKENESAVSGHSALPHLKHCFLIIRENRTFDEVLGDVRGANGDAGLARYGLDGWASEDETARHLKVTPNLHALAGQFAISDNFFVDSDVSADGHRWIVGIHPTPFFNTAWTSGYGGRRSEDPKATGPGRRALFGGADGPMPEDEPQFGSLWEHVSAANAKRPGILNYGEGLELEGSDERAGTEPEGQRLLLNAPLPRPVFESSDRRFPTFNLGIPDQMRVDEFERNFRRRLTQGNLPPLIVIRLPNDHTADARPEDGYPYRASYVADNDLALGRIVAFLSRTTIWKDSAVFVTEDDAQDGVDHVDAHRSILLVASPWVKPGFIAHEHSSMGSITRTIDGLLGLGPLNLEDALAGNLDEMFDTTPHLGVFRILPPDKRAFDPARAKVARPKTQKQAAALRDMDDSDAIREELEGSAGKLRKPGVD